MYTPLAVQLSEEVISASLLRSGDSLTLVGGAGRTEENGAIFPFGGLLDKGNRGAIHVRSVDWNDEVHRMRLSTRTFDIVLYAAHSVEEASVYRVLSRHASLSLVRLPDPIGTAFEAIAKESTPVMGPTFAKALFENHCIPLLTTGTKKSVKDFVRHAETCSRTQARSVRCRLSRLFVTAISLGSSRRSTRSLGS